MEMKASTLGVMTSHRGVPSSQRQHYGSMNGGGGGGVGGAHPNSHHGGSLVSTIQAPPSDCAACQKPIKERYLLKALDQFWHEDCLKCACCDCRLGEVGSTLFTKANLILCKRDYLRLFGTAGMCSACSKSIPPFEMAMKIGPGRVYHLECFQCSHCNHRFCVGDRFHLHENRILCEYDYEELTIYGPGPGSAVGGGGGGGGAPHHPYSSHLEKLKKATESLSSSMSHSSPPPIAADDNGSSGYGSPDSLLSDGK